MDALSFDFDRVMALWPRLHSRLRELARNPLSAYEVIRLAEKRVAQGVTLARALKADTRVSSLPKVAQRKIFSAAREDLAGQARGSVDLLGVKSIKTLDELLQDFRVGDPDLATTAFEAGENLRPEFKRVGHIFVSRHTESTDAQVEEIVDRLEKRGLDCWYASRNVISDWHAETLEAAETCSEGVLLLTRAALFAPYVSAEAKIIINSGRRMLTLLMEPNVRPRDINMALENWQFHRWYENSDAALESLIGALGS